MSHFSGRTVKSSLIPSPQTKILLRRAHQRFAARPILALLAVMASAIVAKG
jgi:hypothetical protein